MKSLFDPGRLPQGAVLFACSSHEERCLAMPQRWGSWRPSRVVLFHYDDKNPRRERNHAELLRLYGARCEVVEAGFTEKSMVESFKRNRTILKSTLEDFPSYPIVLDISVFTKRHLLMMLHWLDDFGCWDRLFVTYSEPEDFQVSNFIPLSFGLSRVEEVPGFSATPDTSRPLHVAIFLGYEGDRTLATYDMLQPMYTTLVIPDPPFKEGWEGKSEELNRDLVSVVGSSSIRAADAIDPESTRALLREVFGPEDGRSEFAKIICPLGTKPQALGIYLYVRKAVDPPALVYTGPLRHNHEFFSRGIRNSWLLMEPR